MAPTGAPLETVFHIDTLAVVGVGLIGGSVAAALRRHAAVGTVLGVGRHPQSIERARRLGLIDTPATLEEAAALADVILLATPVAATEAILTQLAAYLRPRTLVTDVGSTKANVVAAARTALGARASQFVAAHPIAGTERTGPDAADAGLFDGRVVVLTPGREADAAMRDTLTRLWERCGARVVVMAPEAHDRALASVSHLPHFLAAAFMAQVAGAPDADRRLGLAGTGFRDFTRIAAGSPEVWRDIFLANRAAVLAELEAFRTELGGFARALENGDGQELFNFLERAAVARRFWAGRSGLS
ncbi:MAG: prephenate dehydrogenase/arogenate dehydrogenase family protein [Candidimonas sp.]|nr:MAG: prephenate dehydrogenase/arogenate dehydrogenase family protein [Candidimonas sp.]